MVNIKKLESTQKLLFETREKILSDRESWNDYVLNAAVKFYKYNSYVDQLLIHAQRSDATACAAYEVWNDIFKRYVNRNSKSIALLLPGAVRTGCVTCSTFLLLADRLKRREYGL